MGQEFVKKTTLFSVVGTGPISSITQPADIATFLSFLLIFFLFVAGRGFAYVR
jgi:hypothetical protein